LIDWAAVGTLLIRSANAIVWVALCIGVLRRDRPVYPVERRLLVTVLMSGMIVLAIGALTAFGLPGDAARFLYTAFTAYALIVALAIATTAED
jgi:hypothetical protein